MQFGKRLVSFVTIGICLMASGCGAPGGGTTNPNGTGYGPLTFNQVGADFYFAQNGQFARTELGKDGVIEIYLKNAPFQLGHNGRQLNLALAQIPISEISTDPKGFKASRLSGPMAGAREQNSDEIFVYSGTEWSDGNTEFSDTTSKKASPMPGYRFAYQINQVNFLDDDRLRLDNFKGTLYGFILVYKQHQRMNRDIMPVRLIFN